MDLWIRSQSRKDITKVERVGVSLSGLSIVVNGIIYGTFKTEERAMEVLNEIYRFISINYKISALFYEIPEK